MNRIKNSHRFPIFQLISTDYRVNRFLIKRIVYYYLYRNERLET